MDHPRTAAGLPTQEAKAPPTFWFTYNVCYVSGPNLVIYPFGYNDFQPERTELDDRIVVGEVIAADTEHAEVRFAWGTEFAREYAAGALREWAENDHWELEFAEGDFPLTVPAPGIETHPFGGVCSSCREILGTGMWTHVGRQQLGWIRTSCPCGDRMRWYKRPRRRVKGGDAK